MHNQGGRVARLTVDLGERYVDGDSTAGAGPAVHPALLYHRRLLLALNCTLNHSSCDLGWAFQLDELELASEHVAKGRQIIDSQRVMIAKLRAEGIDTTTP